MVLRTRNVDSTLIPPTGVNPAAVPKAAGETQVNRAELFIARVCLASHLCRANVLYGLRETYYTVMVCLMCLTLFPTIPVVTVCVFLIVLMNIWVCNTQIGTHDDGLKKGYKLNSTSDPKSLLYNSVHTVVYTRLPTFAGLMYSDEFPQDTAWIRRDWFDICSMPVYQGKYTDNQKWTYRVPIDLTQLMFTFCNPVRNTYRYMNVFEYLWPGLPASVESLTNRLFGYKYMLMQYFNSAMNQNRHSPTSTAKTAYAIQTENERVKFLYLKSAFRTLMMMAFVSVHAIIVKVSAWIISTIVCHAMKILTELAVISQPGNEDILHDFIPSFISHFSDPNVVLALLLVMVYTCRVVYRIRDLLNL